MRSMRTILTASIFLALLTASSAPAADRRPQTGRLRIMILNADYLWDGAAPEEGSSRFPWKGSLALAEQHMREVAATVLEHDADIVSLAGVENGEALRLFNRKFLADSGYAVKLLRGLDSRSGQDVGLLTRIDPQSVSRDNRRGTSGPGRGLRRSVARHYVARFTIDGRSIALVGVHLRGEPLDLQAARSRQAEADAVRSIALDLAAQDYSLVVLGDFNDLDGDPVSMDHRGHRPISGVLDSIRQLDPDDPTDDLVNLASLVDRRRRFTRFQDRNGNRVLDGPEDLMMTDHILVSPDLAAAVTSVRIPHPPELAPGARYFPVVATFEF